MFEALWLKPWTWTPSPLPLAPLFPVLTVYIFVCRLQPQYISFFDVLMYALMYEADVLMYALMYEMT